MNVLLIDDNPLIQKTLQYFLHSYAPSIYSPNSQKEWPKKIDIVFLDSEQKDSEYVSHLKEKEDTPPIVLLSRNEKTLKELAVQYPVSLKKPIRYSQLQEIIHHLIPETRSFKASPYLKFYEDITSDENEPIALLRQEPPSQETPLESSLMEEEPLKNIPLAAEDSKNELENSKIEKNSQAQSSAETDKQPAFDKKQAVVIPDDIQLVNSEDSTALHNTNTFLKKMSENIKEKLSSKDSETLSEESIPQEPSPTNKNEDDMTITSLQKSKAFQMTEDLTGSQIFEEMPQESSSEESAEFTSENSSEFSSSLDKDKSSVPSDFTNLETQSALSNKILEMIEKNVQDQWKIFAGTQLKKELKKMIHKEVNQIFKEQMKDILTTEGIQSIKKASEEISWKVIPELSKQIIQKEIKKLLNKPSSKKKE